MPGPAVRDTAALVFAGPHRDDRLRAVSTLIGAAGVADIFRIRAAAGHPWTPGLPPWRARGPRKASLTRAAQSARAMTPTQDRFAACAATVMDARGAFLARDPLLDGPSAHGVGLGLLSVWIGGPADATTLKALGVGGAARILRNMVWAPIGAARLPAGPDLALFAYALEAGTMQAMAELQAELELEQTGAPDATTIAAAESRNPADLARAVTARHAAWRRARGLAAPGRDRPPAPRRRALLAAC